MPKTPNTSPRVQRRHLSPTSDGSHDTSYNSYRSANRSGREESDSDSDDQVDRSVTSGNRSHDSLNQSPLGVGNSPSPRVTRNAAGKGPPDGIKGRRPLHRSPGRSPNSPQSSDNVTPPRSEQLGSSPGMGTPSTEGSPSPYKELNKQLDDLQADLQAEEMRSRPASQSPRVRQRGKQESIKMTRSQRMQVKYLPPPTDRQCNGSSFIFFGIVGVVIFLIALTLLLIPSTITEETTLSRFQGRFDELKAKFPEQHHRFWRTLSAATKRVINDERPIQPGVILIGSTHATRREADCIARLFSQVVTEAFESKPPIIIDVGREYTRLTPEDAKVAMETSLRGGFGGGAQSAVISSLEEMHGNTAMLLHAFCDNDNAPFTKVVTLFTLHTEERELGLKDDAKVEEHLSKIWQRHLNIDDVSALLTRVANNVIIPKKESEDVLNKFC